MKTRQQIANKRRSLSNRLRRECACPDSAVDLDGHSAILARKHGAEYATCPCSETYSFELRCFVACVPEQFWYSTREDVFANEDVFDEMIARYLERDNLAIALKHGAGMFLTGPNGCGKSMFLSLICTHLIRNYKAGVYYTTAMTLDGDTKMGFGSDPDSLAAKHDLDKYMMRHFVVLDELGKDKYKGGDSFARRELERRIRDREQVDRPTLMASNLSLSALRAPVDDGGYGETIGSLIEGRCVTVTMEAGDARQRKGQELMGKWAT